MCCTRSNGSQICLDFEGLPDGASSKYWPMGQKNDRPPLNSRNNLTRENKQHPSKTAKWRLLTALASSKAAPPGTVTLIRARGELYFLDGVVPSTSINTAG